MSNIYLFTDGSVNPETNVGFGAYLWVADMDLPTDIYKKKVLIKQFENTSSSQLEIEIALWALNNVNSTKAKITLYTDSQNIVNLLDRRTKLEEKKFRSKKNEVIKNAERYMYFYKLHDLLKFDVVKVKGHQVSKHKNTIDQLFALVDKASRKALREAK